MSTVHPEKDYYSILGVDKKSSADDVKNAYRRLAKSCHPDVGGDPEKFKSVSEAYEILSDPSKRHEYDLRLQFSENPQAGSVWSMGSNGFWSFTTSGDFGFPNSHPPVVKDVKLSISVSMSQAYAGFKTKLKYEKSSPCTKCGGEGRILMGSGKCSGCNGVGTILHGSVKCASCRGSGKNIARCRSCGGSGKHGERVESIIDVPPRTLNMAAVVLKDAGNAFSDGTKGSLVVTVTYPVQHEDMTMMNDGTLIKQIHVPWEESLSGTKWRFKIFEECPGYVDLTLEPSSRNGTSYKIKDAGMGKNADLIVKVWYLLPSNIKEDGRKAIAEAIRKAIKDAQPD